MSEPDGTPDRCGATAYGPARDPAGRPADPATAPSGTRPTPAVRQPAGGGPRPGEPRRPAADPRRASPPASACCCPGSRRGDDSGWCLVRAGFDDLGDARRHRAVAAAGVVLGGGVLFLLGLLMWLPGPHPPLPRRRSALLVSLAVAAGRAGAARQTRLEARRFRRGFWFAIAVAVLGLLGSLKAMLTRPAGRRGALVGDQRPRGRGRTGPPGPGRSARR